MDLPYFKRGAIIDLSTGTVRIDSLDDLFYEDFLGGKGIGAILLYNYLRPSVDPLSPENVLIFATGPLTGSTFPASSRSTAVTKSPLTGAFLDSNMGGSFGKSLKSSGFDYFVITGRAGRPTWISINNQRVEFRDATSLCGMTTSETEAAIQKEVNSKSVEVLAVGPAGEKQVLYAGMACGGRMFGRGGAGAVMGSKNLKAVAVQGTTDLPWFSKPAFKGQARRSIEKLSTHPATKKGGQFPSYGTSFTTEVMQTVGLLPTRNWQESTYEDADKISSQAFFDRKVGSAACFRCPIRCASFVKVEGETIRRPEYETIYAFGSNCGIGSPDVIIRANLLCEDFGMDTISCGVTISFIMECTERGIIDGNSGIPHLKFGDEEGLLETVRSIGEGSLPLCGEGTKRLSQRLGAETHRFAMAVKGLELPGYDPRGMKAMALLYATSDRGGCHVRGSSLRSELLGMPAPVDRFAYEGKAGLAAMLQKNYALMNSYSECLFAGFGLNLDDYAAILATLFDEPVTPESLLATGKRIWDTTRLFNCREGFSAKDDTLPARLFDDPIPSGPSAGQVIDRGAFERMKKEYYGIQGWDESGVPALDIKRYLLKE
jgi:aldehyde:ferredoxin oxidoreductase